tara:strand:+ start:518 stop:700 length:183 start_codon:yes stop_codon:yes gene_type:complete
MTVFHTFHLDLQLLVLEEQRHDAQAKGRQQGHEYNLIPTSREVGTLKHGQEVEANEAKGQ